MPRVVNRIGEAVCMAAGTEHSLVITTGGHVLAFGANGEVQGYDSELDETVFYEYGCLGLGAEVKEALTPTVIDGITMGGGGEGKEGRE